MLFKIAFDATHVNTTFSERAEYLCEKAKHDVIYKKRLANTNAKNSTSVSPYSTLAQKWPAVRNHTTNKVRILVCKILQKDQAPDDMVQYICFNTKVPGDKPFTGVGRKGSCYKAILGTVGRIKAQYGHGEFDNILGGTK